MNLKAIGFIIFSFITGCIRDTYPYPALENSQRLTMSKRSADFSVQKSNPMIMPISSLTPKDVQSPYPIRTEKKLRLKKFKRKLVSKNEVGLPTSDSKYESDALAPQPGMGVKRTKRNDERVYTADDLTISVSIFQYNPVLFEDLISFIRKKEFELPDFLDFFEELEEMKANDLEIIGYEFIHHITQLANNRSALLKYLDKYTGFKQLFDYFESGELASNKNYQLFCAKLKDAVSALALERFQNNVCNKFKFHLTSPASFKGYFIDRIVELLEDYDLIELKNFFMHDIKKLNKSDIKTFHSFVNQLIMHKERITKIYVQYKDIIEQFQDSYRIGLALKLIENPKLYGSRVVDMVLISMMFTVDEALRGNYDAKL